jgi:hypothetical protein
MIALERPLLIELVGSVSGGVYAVCKRRVAQFCQ